MLSGAPIGEPLNFGLAKTPSIGFQPLSIKPVKYSLLDTILPSFVLIFLLSVLITLALSIPLKPSS
uniref:Uncharacterized protein n=1 Tax=uncultured marine virus TaxID=186617 RepID=A0A0F7L356_9VIRU|nr:hypothetical protein [uncultured marine virus]